MLIRFRQWWHAKKKAREEARWPERKIIISLGPEVISATYPNGTVESASIQSLNTVEVHTDDSGPWGADVWFIFASASGDCRFPQGATGEKEALDFMFALPGFDNEQFIKAMGSTSNAVFPCWQKLNAL